MKCCGSTGRNPSITGRIITGRPWGRGTPTRAQPDRWDFRAWKNGEEKKLYPVSDSFQGTLAARSGYRVPDDTIEVYWPDQKEELVVTYVQEQTKSASLYAAEKLKTRDKYGMFLNGNHPLTEIRTMASTGRKLLLIKDSYANCFVPFLTGDFEEIVLVDPRYYYDSAEKLMKQYGFTDVLFLYNLNTFLEDDVLHYVLE